MNILYIADPNLIHDIRWIKSIAAKGNTCYLLPRARHFREFLERKNTLPASIILLDPIEDPSTRMPFRDLLQALKIFRVVRKNRIRLMHIIYAEPGALWGNWKFLFNVPMVLTTLGTDILITIPSFFQRGDLLSKVVARKYRRALNKFDAITCTSESQRQKLHTLKVKVRVDLVRTGVDMELVRDSGSDVIRRIGLDKPFILMPRNMRRIYNHEFTLSAIGLLRKEILNKFCFAFVDANTLDQAYFNSVVEKARTIPADIRFFPSFSHSEIISLLKQASVVVMNPVSDGSPVSAMEAIACCTPVILPPLMYDPEIFGSCFFFDQWQPESLKSKLEEVLALDRGVLEKRLSQGSQIILQHGDINDAIRRIESIYQSCL